MLGIGGRRGGEGGGGGGGATHPATDAQATSDLMSMLNIGGRAGPGARAPALCPQPIHVDVDPPQQPPPQPEPPSPGSNIMAMLGIGVGDCVSRWAG
jgi:hypothetical protein